MILEDSCGWCSGWGKKFQAQPSFLGAQLWLNFPVGEAELPSFLGVAEALNGNSFLGWSILGWLGTHFRLLAFPFSPFQAIHFSYFSNILFWDFSSYPLLALPVYAFPGLFIYPLPGVFPPFLASQSSHSQPSHTLSSSILLIASATTFEFIIESASSNSIQVWSAEEENAQLEWHHDVKVMDICNIKTIQCKSSHFTKHYYLMKVFSPILCQRGTFHGSAVDWRLKRCSRSFGSFAMRLPDNNFTTKIQVIPSNTSKEDCIPPHLRSMNGYYLEAGMAPRMSWCISEAGG